MSDLKERVEFYIGFMERQIAKEEAKPRQDLDFIRGLDKGYSGAFTLVVKWLREAMEEAGE